MDSNFGNPIDTGKTPTNGTLPTPTVPTLPTPAPAPTPTGPTITPEVPKAPDPTPQPVVTKGEPDKGGHHGPSDLQKGLLIAGGIILAGVVIHAVTAKGDVIRKENPTVLKVPQEDGTKIVIGEAVPNLFARAKSAADTDERRKLVAQMALELDAIGYKDVPHNLRKNDVVYNFDAVLTDKDGKSHNEHVYARRSNDDNTLKFYVDKFHTHKGFRPDANTEALFDNAVGPDVVISNLNFKKITYTDGDMNKNRDGARELYEGELAAFEKKFEPLVEKLLAPTVPVAPPVAENPVPVLASTNVPNKDILLAIDELTDRLNKFRSDRNFGQENLVHAKVSADVDYDINRQIVTANTPKDKQDPNAFRWNSTVMDSTEGKAVSISTVTQKNVSIGEYITGLDQTAAYVALGQTTFTKIIENIPNAALKKELQAQYNSIYNNKLAAPETIIGEGVINAAQKLQAARLAYEDAFISKFLKIKGQREGNNQLNAIEKAYYRDIATSTTLPPFKTFVDYLHDITQPSDNKPTQLSKALAKDDNLTKLYNNISVERKALWAVYGETRKQGIRERLIETVNVKPTDITTVAKEEAFVKSGKAADAIVALGVKMGIEQPVKKVDLNTELKALNAADLAAVGKFLNLQGDFFGKDTPEANQAALTAIIRDIAAKNNGSNATSQAVANLIVNELHAKKIGNETYVPAGITPAEGSPTKSNNTLPKAPVNNAQPKQPVMPFTGNPTPGVNQDNQNIGQPTGPITPRAPAITDKKPLSALPNTTAPLGRDAAPTTTAGPNTLAGVLPTAVDGNITTYPNGREVGLTTLKAGDKVVFYVINPKDAEKPLEIQATKTADGFFDLNAAAIKDGVGNVITPAKHASASQLADVLGRNLSIGAGRPVQVIKAPIIEIKATPNQPRPSEPLVPATTTKPDGLNIPVENDTPPPPKPKDTGAVVQVKVLPGSTSAALTATPLQWTPKTSDFTGLNALLGAKTADGKTTFIMDPKSQNNFGIASVATPVTNPTAPKVGK